MRLAVFSDVHANLEALDAVLADSVAQGVDRHVCLGDVVGYGANPNQCIERLLALPHCACILGNHDAAAMGMPGSMKREARYAIHWTRKVLSPESMEFLREMQDVITWGELLFCHSNPYRPRRWYYVSEKTYIASSFARSKAKILFVGHTHVPVAITRQNFFCVYIRSPQHRVTVPVAELNRQIFNCGSVGQPRDGDPRASYLVYDDERHQVEFYRVAYDYRLAAEKILASGLPEPFARRLIYGK